MFGKVFASLWQGSMVGKADAQLVFVYLLANCDRDGFVDVTHEVIGALTGIGTERVREAIDLLESPDPRSRSAEKEGRRIVRKDEHRDWGWHVVNHAYYRGLRDEESRRAEARDRMRRVRGVEGGPGGGCELFANVRHGSPSFAHSREQIAEADKGTPPAEASPERRKAGASGASLEGRTSSGTGEASNGAGRARGASGDPSEDRAEVEPIPLADGSEWRPSRGEFVEWVRLFPAVKVAGEFARMRAWALANPKKRKTARGVRAFVRSWLDEEQNKGGRREAGPARSRIAREYLEANPKGEAGQ